MAFRRVILLFLLTACGTSNDVIKKQIDAHFTALNGKDEKVLLQDYAVNAIGDAPNWGRTMHGRDSILFQYHRLFTSTPDLLFTITKVSIGDDHATVEYAMAGTLSKLEEGVPEFMRGKKYSFVACSVFQFKGNKIINESSYFDQVAFLRQMNFFDQK